MVTKTIKFEDEVYADFKEIAVVHFPFNKKWISRLAFTEALKCFIKEYKDRPTPGTVMENADGVPVGMIDYGGDIIRLQKSNQYPIKFEMELHGIKYSLIRTKDGIQCYTKNSDEIDQQLVDKYNEDFDAGLYPEHIEGIPKELFEGSEVGTMEGTEQVVVETIPIGAEYFNEKGEKCIKTADDGILGYVKEIVEVADEVTEK